MFADIGAGTGKLTKELAKRGYTVYAVEPNEDMRVQLAITLSAYTNTKIIGSAAENTTLPDKSIDVITVAHALHWFDIERFKAECCRILKPDGIVIVIYNHVPGREESDFCRQAVDRFFSNPVIWTFNNPISYTRDDWIAYIQSQDDSILPGEQGYEEYILSLNKAFDRDSIDGVLCCDRLTRVYVEESCKY
ncbi:MAG: class I SAM-dependent methyltransferase [Acetatifactor sp.]|nr:class I SAM-dependent methyltransferase [Acetatifactor sp.]